MRIKDLSINSKISLLTFLISTVAIVIAVMIFYHYDKNMYLDKLKRDLAVLAEVIGRHNDANLEFDGRKQAKNYLQALSKENRIEQAVLLDTVSREPFAYYTRDQEPPEDIPDIAIQKDTSFMKSQSLHVFKPVYSGNTVIGNIYLEANLEEFRERIGRFLFIILLMILAIPIVLLILTSNMQKVITRPIIRLHKSMQKVGEKQDYSVRADAENKDEIGQLAQGFNQMLQRIEKQNQQLQQAKKRAEDSLKAKDQFLANISHEIRTPMNTILGMTNILLDTSINKKQKNYLQNVKISATNLLVIINDILDFSKIQSGKLQLEHTAFELPRKIDEVLEAIRLRIEEKELEIRYEKDEQLPTYVMGDPVRLNQILLNLLTNAVKFTETGYIKLKVKVIGNKQKQQWLHFEVADTGIGIDQDQQKHIFESFRQASSSTSRKYGGTGLGLAISKQLVDLSGGTIHMESTPGEGSRFYFKIPMEVVGPEKIRKKEESTADNLEASYKEYLKSHEPFRILLVEDNSMNQLLARTLLEKHNFKVGIANNGFEALEEIKTNDYDLILMDIHMPDKDGYQTTIEIRRHPDPKINALPIIALTAAATKSEVNKSLKVGMNDFISKPFKYEILLSKILSQTLKN